MGEGEITENEEEEDDNLLDANTGMNDDEQNEIEQYANSKVNKHVNGQTSRQIKEKKGILLSHGRHTWEKNCGGDVEKTNELQVLFSSC